MTIVVTVESPRGRLTIRIPDDVPVEQLLPDLLDSTGCQPGSGRWSLVPRGGDALDRERTLRQSGLYQGAILQLRAEDPGPGLATPRPPAPWAEIASLQLRRAGGWAWRAGGQARLPVTKETGAAIRNPRRPVSGDLDGGLASALAEPGLVIAVLSEEQGAGATTVTALLATLLPRLRQAPVAAVDTEGPSGRLSLYLTPADRQPATHARDGLRLLPAPVPAGPADAEGEAAYDALFAQLGRLGGLAVVDCGLPASLGARATLARADVCVAVSRAPGAAAGWTDLTAGLKRRPDQRLVAAVNRAGRPAPGRPRRDTVAAAEGTLSLTYEPAAASRLRAGVFSWEDAPRSWKAEVRALAETLLVGHQQPAARSGQPLRQGRHQAVGTERAGGERDRGGHRNRL
jgi:hypothetical protein